MLKPRTDRAKGVLKTEEYTKRIWHNRYFPSSEVAPFVEHYWIVRWDFTGLPPNTQEVLAHPSVHLVFEKGSTRVWGVQTGKFVRVLENKGVVLGIKFHPGGFYPFYKKPINTFTDKLLPFHEAFPDNITLLEKAILDHKEDAVMISRAEKFMRNHLPEKDMQADEMRQIVDQIRNDPSILKVNELTALFPYTKRTLQRLFKQYVGVSPKWVIQRYRLHEAAEKITMANKDNWAGIAAELGYYDQAHFIRDFKRIVGMAPEQFAREIGKT